MYNKNCQIKYVQSILLTKVLISSSLLPQSPFPSTYDFLFLKYTPLGHLSLNGQTELLAFLKFGPTVTISWIKSSVQIISLYLRAS